MSKNFQLPIKKIYGNFWKLLKTKENAVDNIPYNEEKSAPRNPCDKVCDSLDDTDGVSKPSSLGRIDKGFQCTKVRKCPESDKSNMEMKLSMIFKSQCRYPMSMLTCATTVNVNALVFLNANVLKFVNEY